MKNSLSLGSNNQTFRHPPIVSSPYFYIVALAEPSGGSYIASNLS